MPHHGMFQVELIYDVVKLWNILPRHMRDLLGESTMIYWL
jgi:hypothetical protein